MSRSGRQLETWLLDLLAKAAEKSFVLSGENRAELARALDQLAAQQPQGEMRDYLTTVSSDDFIQHCQDYKNHCRIISGLVREALHCRTCPFSKFGQLVCDSPKEMAWMAAVAILALTVFWKVAGLSTASSIVCNSVVGLLVILLVAWQAKVEVAKRTIGITCLAGFSVAVLAVGSIKIHDVAVAAAPKSKLGRTNEPMGPMVDAEEIDGEVISNVKPKRGAKAHSGPYLLELGEAEGNLGYPADRNLQFQVMGAPRGARIEAANLESNPSTSLNHDPWVGYTSESQPIYFDTKTQTVTVVPPEPGLKISKYNVVVSLVGPGGYRKTITGDFWVFDRQILVGLSPKEFKVSVPTGNVRPTRAGVIIDGLNAPASQKFSNTLNGQRPSADIYTFKIESNSLEGGSLTISPCWGSEYILRYEIVEDRPRLRLLVRRQAADTQDSQVCPVALGGKEVLLKPDRDGVFVFTVGNDLQQDYIEVGPSKVAKVSAGTNGWSGVAQITADQVRVLNLQRTQTTYLPSFN